MEKKIKQYPIVIKEASEDGGRIVITTPDVDRDKDRVMPKGLILDNYLKNPVVAWAHNYRDPWALIGKSNSLDVSDKGIEADFSLRPAANDADPQNIIRLLWAGRWVVAASIGFDPFVEKDAIKENEFGGFDFLVAELLEWSLVPIPANQSALRLALKARQVSLASQPEREIEFIQQVSNLLRAGNVSEAAVLALLEKADDPPVTIPAPVFPTEPETPVETEEPDEEPETPAKIKEPDDDPEPDDESGSGDEPERPWLDKGLEQPEFLAWVRMLEVEDYHGKPQTIIAGFNADRVEIPKDAEKATINEYGEIEFVPHPEAGKTFYLRSVSYLPPIEIWDGEDAIYAASGRVDDDEELIAPYGNEYKITALGDVTLSLPWPLESGEPEPKQLKRVLDLCRVTSKNFRLASLAFKRFQRRVKILEGKLAESQNLAEDGATDPIVKSGRVLSAKNEGKIREARDLLDEVLESVADQEESDNDDKTADDLTDVFTADDLIELKLTALALRGLAI